MNFFQAVRSCFKKTFIINGRASRSEYWWFVLFYFIAFIGFSLIFAFSIDLARDASASANAETSLGITLLALGGYALIMTVLTIQWFTVSIRRLHDMGYSGLFILLSFIPYIGLLVFIGIGIKDGDYGPNEYGPDPSEG